MLVHRQENPEHPDLHLNEICDEAVAGSTTAAGAAWKVLDLRGRARCYERRATVINAFFDLAATIITVRSLIRRAWTTHRWEDRPRRTP